MAYIEKKIRLPDPKSPSFQEELIESLTRYTTKLSDILNGGLRLQENFSDVSLSSPLTNQQLHLGSNGKWTNFTDPGGAGTDHSTLVNLDYASSGHTGFSPSTHTHDDRYYTESELDLLLAAKSDVTHNHDAVYSAIGHTHDERYYTESEIDTLLGGYLTAETDPVFSAWLAATPPLYSEADPLSLHLSSTNQIVTQTPTFQSGAKVGDDDTNLIFSSITDPLDLITGTFPLLLINSSDGNRLVMVGGTLSVVQDDFVFGDPSEQSGFGHADLVFPTYDISLPDGHTNYMGRITLLTRSGTISSYSTNQAEYNTALQGEVSLEAIYAGTEDYNVQSRGLRFVVTGRETHSSSGKTLTVERTGAAIEVEDESNTEIAGTMNAVNNGLEVYIDTQNAQATGTRNNKFIWLRGNIKAGDTSYAIYDDVALIPWKLDGLNKHIEFYSASMAIGADADNHLDLWGPNIDLNTSSNCSMSLSEYTFSGMGNVPIITFTSTGFAGGSYYGGIKDALVIVENNQPSAIGLISSTADDNAWFERDDNGMIDIRTDCEGQNGGVYLRSNHSVNPVWKHGGYLTGVGNSDYIQTQLSDTDDWYHITRSSSNIGGVSIDMPLDVGGDLSVTTGTNTSITSDELTLDLTSVIPGLYLTAPLLNGVSHSSLPDTIPFPYALGTYNTVGIFDKSDRGFVEILFASIDFLNNAVITGNLAETRFEVNWDWCPSEDNTYSLGTSALRWLNGYFSGSVGVSGTLDLTGVTASIEAFKDKTYGSGVDGDSLYVYRGSAYWRVFGGQYGDMLMQSYTGLYLDTGIGGVGDLHLNYYNYGDIKCFDGTDIADASDGKSFYVYRPASEGDSYFRQYIDQYGQGWFQFRTNISGGWQPLLIDSPNGVSLNNGTTFLSISGYVTTPDTNKWVKQKMDTDGWYKFAGEDAYVLGIEIGMPLRITDKVMFTQTDGNEYIDSLNDGYMDYGATTAHRFNTALELAGKITKYDNVATEGMGVAVVMDAVALTGQTADTSGTFSNTNVAGLYRVTWYLETTTSDADAGTCPLTISWTDDIGSTSYVGADTTIVLTSTDRKRGMIDIRVASGSIAWAVGHTGIYDSAVYAVHLTCERLN